MTEQLHKFNVCQYSIEKLKTFKPRCGFVLIDDREFAEMLDYFKQFPIYKDIIPIMTDEQSNYWCVYISGAMKGMVCHLSHDEISLEPRFKNISNLISAVENNAEAHNFYDWEEWENNVFDFPATKDLTEFTERKQIIDQLSLELKTETDEQRIQQLAFSIMALTSIDDIETNIYPFLDDEEMYIQERAIEMLGFHKYKLAKEKLIELETTAMPNGRNAAKIALKNIV